MTRGSRDDLRRFVPSTAAELEARGWTELDVLLITADAHVDHPSFPAAILGRVLMAAGWRVGLIPRPDVSSTRDITRLGRPRLFVGVTAGALDSMVSNYTAAKRRRSDDAYAPGGRAGGPNGRPDRALTVYGNLCRRAFGKETLLVAGGLEASLRRFAHYDYWGDKVRRSLLMDCGADVLVHGMGEAVIRAIATRLDLLDQQGRLRRVEALDALSELDGVVYRTPGSRSAPESGVSLASAEDVARDPRVHAETFRVQERKRRERQWQVNGGSRVIANPPPEPPSPEELDAVFALPYTRDVHPIHGGLPVPALAQVRFSVTSHRGCFGGCAFCAIGAHQGTGIQSRSEAGIFAEIDAFGEHPAYAGVVNDVGGPTANMYALGCTRPSPCERPSCVHPKICPQLETDHARYVELLRRASARPGVRKLFVTTGVRMDLACSAPAFIERLARHHTSGRLKVAPEHMSPEVLRLMRKPEGLDLDRFLGAFRQHSRAAGKEQYVLPYFIAAHPGSRLRDMLDVALWLSDTETRVEQVQIFTPTPGTAATVMYATGLDPDSLEPVYVERDPKRKALQKALLLYRQQENRPLVRTALTELGRQDLIPRLLDQKRAPSPTTKRKPRR